MSGWVDDQGSQWRFDRVSQKWSKLVDGRWQQTALPPDGLSHFSGDAPVDASVRIIETMGPEGPAGPTGPAGTPGGPQGPEGPRGLPGTPGVTGARGPQGMTGPRGEAGPQGDTGATGPRGALGPIGATGPAGPQGNPGATGAVGATGPRGLAGLIGATGPAGVTGAQGPQGLQGLRGDTGATGPTGLTGAQGLRGLTGNPGAAGSTGPQGPVGSTGPVGPQGLGAFVDFGYCQSELSSLDWFNETESRKILQGIKDSGATRVRIAAWWGAFETARNVFSWDGLDRAMNLCGQYALTPLLCVTPGGYPPSYPTPVSADYANACGALAARYGAAGTNQCHDYELWNEVNHAAFAAPFTFGAATYTAVLIAASTAIRAADAQAFIISSGLMSTVNFSSTDILPSTYLQGIYDYGGKGHFDAIGFHWYNYTADFATWQEPSATQIFYADLLQCRAVAIAQGDTAVPFWLTEVGYRRDVTPERKRARWMAEQIQMITDLDWIETFFVYNYRDNSATDTPDNHYGVVTWTGDDIQPTRDIVASSNAAAPGVTARRGVGWDELDITGAGGTHTAVMVDSAGNLSTGPVSNVLDAPHAVFFNSTAGTWPTRPAGANAVVWIGGAAPTQPPPATSAGDVWIPTSGDGTPLGSTLTAVSTATPAANKLLLFTGPTAATTVDFKTENTLASASDTAVPSQKAVKYYIDHVVANPQAGTAYTLAASDIAGPVEMTSASPNVVTIANNGVVPIDVGSVINVISYGTGQTTISAAAGVTLNTVGGKRKLTGQFSMVSLRQRLINEWVGVGDLTT